MLSESRRSCSWAPWPAVHPVAIFYYLPEPGRHVSILEMSIELLNIGASGIPTYLHGLRILPLWLGA